LDEGIGTVKKIILALLLATPALVSAETKLWDYATEQALGISLYKADGTEHKVDATFEAGDCKIRIDAGTEANCANLPTDKGTGYDLVLTAAELTGKRVEIYLVDQTSPRAWLDKNVSIETKGDAASMHPNVKYRSITR
jgi:hypothetical protein